MTRDPQPPDPGLDPVDRLAAAAAALLEELEELGDDAGRQFTSLTKRSQQNRRMILVVVAGFLLDVALTAAMAVGLLQVNNNTARIDALTQRLDMAQTTQRQKALCPLYQVLIDLKSPQGRERAPDPEKYDHAFEVMTEGYQVLNCAEFNRG
ncbi:hypothetical protein DMA15_03460 [Streptomyces sp. WAC 01529]|uniref:hypothetical protein n=1 Tax=Streptomyces sp. WAC 01529 TaxID=2203205 RepID=UPI000F701378|nr:hypothetical protein [Streptomyces sp. WAC 01529]AZM51751.1 hypothetical protein DMA15_03460 [Streptomyces sp. WAC 01529]